ncbi:MAG: hypothetical protein AAF191_09210 [Verrucomicrobiota bacterium]
MLRLIPLAFCFAILSASASPIVLEARASDLDPEAAPHPEINFVFEHADGKPADLQRASVDPSTPSRDRLVIWLMSYNATLFQILNQMGLHAIQPHYANRWFSLCCQGDDLDEHCRGNIRLEAATGEDVSPHVTIPPADGMITRARTFVHHLAKTHPEGEWSRFFHKETGDLLWEKIILAGSSHGSTTASRLAKHQRVARVVALCGPRDQHQSWQELPSATPEHRYFAFSHVLDTGWVGDHYCRSWELMGLHHFGPIVTVDDVAPPYENTRRLVTNFDVEGDAKRAHGAVTPGKSSKRTAEGELAHLPVWEYLFTHPVEEIGEATPLDPDCMKRHPLPR